jgi:hypothetical protein
MLPATNIDKEIINPFLLCANILQDAFSQPPPKELQICKVVDGTKTNIIW